ncbi:MULTISPECIES: phosphatase PAP2 family protein [Aeromonas]|uniref:phosphatase PAP2 family protein n=1 Tax=Aeromonas TaxID=642 RepID=UPI0009DEA529|nr:MULTISPECIES: phosphatase PAP2 family protein [Aeromonas]MCH7372172.1 phosphatase PAP2 family protein [Aeromonas sp. MR16]
MKRTLIYVAMMVSHVGSTHAASTFETYGDIAQFAIPAIATGISWYKGDYEGMKELGFGVLSTTATVEILKFSVDATRPNGSPHSFPSGHTALAFSGASYLQMRYGWSYGLPAYIAAGAVGWSRVTSDNHYWRDVIASAVIATGFSYAFTSPYEQKLAIYPGLLEDGAQGVLVSFRY